MRFSAQNYHDQFSTILSRVSVKPANEEELVELNNYIKNSKHTVEDLVRGMDEIHRRIEIMNGMLYELSESDLELFWSIKDYPKQVQEVTESSLHALEEEKQRMFKALQQEKEQFEKHLAELDAKVKAFKTHDDADNLAKVCDEGASTDAQLRSAVERVEDFNKREAAFGLPASDYPTLVASQEEFEPYFRLWMSLQDFIQKKQVWTTGSFMELQAEEIDRDVTEWWTMSYKLKKQLEEENPDVAKVAGLLREETDAFRKYLPIIQSLASPALRDRRWQQLSEKLGKQVTPDDELTLQQLIDEGIADQMEVVEEICVVAEKEFKLDKELTTMQKEWDEMAFEVVPYKETGTFVIRGTDDIG
ncbi:Dnah1, partial [Symbiodinium sp. KB8]